MCCHMHKTLAFPFTTCRQHLGPSFANSYDNYLFTIPPLSQRANLIASSEGMVSNNASN